MEGGINIVDMWIDGICVREGTRMEVCFEYWKNGFLLIVMEKILSVRMLLRYVFSRCFLGMK